MIEEDPSDFINLTIIIDTLSMCLPQKDHDHDGDEEPIGHLWEFRQGLLDIHKVKIKQKAIYPLSLDCGKKIKLALGESSNTECNCTSGWG